ncbi:arsenate reductase family protein [Paracoccus thiocyanatus]|nr:ArsC/Spx/MgsR family protein [Paracoccus thiocyanatus]
MTAAISTPTKRKKETAHDHSAPADRRASDEISVMAGRLQMYGLAHCSTCQKAQAALQAAGWQVDFRDVAKAPLDGDEWQRMIAEFGEKLVNRASLTWRAMSDEERGGTPLQMLSAKPSLMKRPAIVESDQRLLGWTANVKRALGVAA